MTYDNFTAKAQEAIQKGQQICLLKQKLETKNCIMTKPSTS